MITDNEFSTTSNPFVFIQNMLNTTKCYDIMQNSSKVSKNNLTIYIYIYFILNFHNT